MRDALLLFIRNPVYGQVKTRLAASLGPRTALRIYQALLDRLRELTDPLAVDKYLYYSDFLPDDDSWPADRYHKCLQVSGDLGLRMEAAFDAALRHHRRVVLVGSDIPGLRREILQEAFEGLSGHDFTIGPAEDGGYYLLGMREPAPAVFREISWSTSAVFAQTVEAIRRTGKTHLVLPRLADIDEAADWVRHGWHLPD